MEGGVDASEAVAQSLCDHFGVDGASGVIQVTIVDVGTDGPCEMDHVSRVELRGEDLCEEWLFKAIADEVITVKVREFKLICFLWSEV